MTDKIAIASEALADIVKEYCYRIWKDGAMRPSAYQPPAIRKAMDAIDALLAAPVKSRDWIEDAEHENGNYSCQCVTCGRTFTGHKRRVVCKSCAAEAPGKSERAREVDELIKWFGSVVNVDPKNRLPVQFSSQQASLLYAEIVRLRPTPPSAPAGETGSRVPRSNIPDGDKKRATLVMKLSADSGYEAEATYRISADQWTAILKIGEDVPVRALAQETNS